MSQFEAPKDIPQWIGDIGGSHIPIRRPVLDGDSFFNRKNWYSVVLEACVDWRGRFCDVTCMWSGRVSDARVFRNSSLGMHIQTIFYGPKVRLAISQSETVTLPYFLLGDSAYANTHSVVTTFEVADVERDKGIKEHNRKLSGMRYKVECAFGQLKGRWRILLTAMEQDTHAVPAIFVSLCLLQKFCPIGNICGMRQQQKHVKFCKCFKMHILIPVPVLQRVRTIMSTPARN